jgi:hypothetical protein
VCTERLGQFLDIVAVLPAGIAQHQVYRQLGEALGQLLQQLGDGLRIDVGRVHHGLQFQGDSIEGASSTLIRGLTAVFCPCCTTAATLA